MNKIFNLFGGRTIKTGVAVFITAWICLQLNLPAIFAVITAIVTIEPTASDSMKKGIVRLPAAAIGAAFSMSLTHYLGHGAIVYALSAVLTIAACYKLKLFDGILVATLTAVMMIPTTGDHHLMAFVSRLGTTTIGLVVSTVVNLFILPPNYSKSITTNLSGLLQKCSVILNGPIKENVIGEKNYNRDTVKQLEHVSRKLETTTKLTEYIREEWKYHRHTKKQIREYHYELKKLYVLQQMVYHLKNLSYTKFADLRWNKTEKQTVIELIESVSTILSDPGHSISDDHLILVDQVNQQFLEWKNRQNKETTKKYHHHFSAETIVVYEILSIHDLIEELEGICKQESKRGIVQC
ncbi:FUSC family protein [Bacillus luteolus]|uniref:FUSC family protein n=1 Tax=Litchfieldia luteola TaxID=682179 RepID=A0ABR9QPV1_9BACI|nr:aromatic acid exporter family protein [Cytobacillus luteolus]MBE4910426.1 FUSC family protein [Cytobacillus luteolus]MBP1941998.1 uncharacterized membrane protein YgaE (UPF0421/DUF939 family) [Cytobacillus luteolus]